MQLLDLKYWYDRYKDFWPEWKNHKYTGLDSRDARNIELFRDNHFKINTTMLEEFHTRDEIHERLVTPLVLKLEAHYPDYKQWVGMMFQVSLVKYATTYGIDLFFSLPITVLPVDLRDRKQLLRFNCATINEILKKLNSEDFSKEPVFKNVLKLSDFVLNAPNKEIFALDKVLTETCET